jgi:SAM-dependent methyltransferase
MSEPAALRPGVKRLLSPILDRFWPRIDAHIAEAMRPVPVEELHELRRHLPVLLDAISAQNASARELSRRMDRLERQTWDTLSDLTETSKKQWERIETIRTEVMYEMRYGGQSTVLQSEIEPKILNPEKLAEQGDDVRLNLGAGHIPREGYLNVDARPMDGIDIVADISNLPFSPGTVAEIHSEHLLEHFPEEALRRRFLPYWVSLLKPGGTFSAVTPDAGAMLDEYAAGRFSFEDLRLVTFGGQEYDGDFHFTMFTADRLEQLLREAGLTDVTVKACGRRNGVCLEMELEARRPG